MRTADFNNHLVVKAKLFGGLTESSHHLKIKKVDGVVLHNLILVVLFEANGIGNASSCFDDLVDHIIADWAVLETDDVDHAVGFDCVVVGEVGVYFSWLLQVLLLFGLAYAYVWEAVGDYDSRLSEVVHLVQVVVPFGGHSQAEDEGWGHGGLPVCLGFGHVHQQLVPYILDRGQRYISSCISAGFKQFLHIFLVQIANDFALSKIIDRILDVRIEVDHSHDGIGSFTFDSADILRNTHFNNLLSRYILQFLFLFAHFIAFVLLLLPV